ncbi:cytochrome P-450 monooxygenase [Fusarium heterosporum]|uniref:Cytochrome P-450 monooxygenase n=1 Tax=Fusarium heterosporum TaxID=42747 RepID=A0A8H5U201_FUSHE|nr:cytochrome P-450 monooxygenase [Fusarium heterosporum]
MAIVVPGTVTSVFFSHGIAILAVLPALYLIASFFYYTYFHPLANIPGPKLYGASQLPYLYHLIQGDWVRVLAKLHDQYGPVVRFAPNDVSFITATAFKTIYGHKSSGGKDFGKDLRIYRQGRPVTHLITSNQQDHKRMRRLLSHAFSQKALHSQEEIMNQYVDLFIARLTEKDQSGAHVNMVAWYNFATFDLIGHLALGQSFKCLESGKYHPWVSNIFNGVRAVTFTQAIVRLGLKSWIPWLTPRKFKAATRDVLQFAEHAALARLSSNDTESQDFMSYVLRYNDERGMSEAEIIENSNLLITAGSETTATCLSGATYLLLTNRDKYDRLAKEIRSAFNSEEEITSGRCDQLKYLVAVFQETLRMYPPAPTGFFRVSPIEGEFIDGYWIPGNTGVGVPHFPAFTSRFNFKDPERFIPERWMDDPSYANDNRAVLQPFSAGPRDCIGKNLAHNEMRLLLTRLLWKFDLEILPENKGWFDQRVFVFWEKRGLQVKLTAVNRIPA